MTNLRLRCRDPNGKSHNIMSLNSSSTLNELMNIICELSGVCTSTQKITMGYPPTPLDLSNPLKTLAEMKVSSGNMLNVVETDKKKTAMKIAANEAKHAPVPCVTMRKNSVPADNSCLFYSVYYCMNNGNFDATKYNEAKKLRARVAQAVRNNPEEYTEAVLEKTPDLYSVWIQDDQAWGGAIELRILSRLLQIEIVAFDIQTVRPDRYGMDMNFPRRIFVIYDGTHYDPVSLSEDKNFHIPETTIFMTNDDCAFEQVKQLAQQMNKSRQFVDLNSCKFFCKDCNRGFKGQVEMMQHCKETRHQNFTQL